MSIEVFKFGGVAVGSADAIRTAIEHVRGAAPRVAAVVSAASGVTALLLDAAQAALRGDRISYLTRAKQFEARHFEIIDALFTSRTRIDRLRALLSESTSEMRSMADSIA